MLRTSSRNDNDPGPRPSRAITEENEHVLRIGVYAALLATKTHQIMMDDLRSDFFLWFNDEDVIDYEYVEKYIIIDDNYLFSIKTEAIDPKTKKKKMSHHINNADVENVKLCLDEYLETMETNTSPSYVLTRWREIAGRTDPNKKKQQSPPKKRPKAAPAPAADVRPRQRGKKDPPPVLNGVPPEIITIEDDPPPVAPEVITLADSPPPPLAMEPLSLASSSSHPSSSTTRTADRSSRTDRTSSTSATPQMPQSESSVPHLNNPSGQPTYWGYNRKINPALPHPKDMFLMFGRIPSGMELIMYFNLPEEEIIKKFGAIPSSKELIVMYSVKTAQSLQPSGEKFLAEGKPIMFPFPWTVQHYKKVEAAKTSGAPVKPGSKLVPVVPCWAIQKLMYGFNPSAEAVIEFFDLPVEKLRLKFGRYPLIRDIVQWYRPETAVLRALETMAAQSSWTVENSDEMSLSIERPLTTSPQVRPPLTMKEKVEQLQKRRQAMSGASTSSTISPDTSEKPKYLPYPQKFRQLYTYPDIKKSHKETYEMVEQGVPLRTANYITSSSEPLENFLPPFLVPPPAADNQALTDYINNYLEPAEAIEDNGIPSIAPSLTPAEGGLSHQQVPVAVPAENQMAVQKTVDATMSKDAAPSGNDCTQPSSSGSTENPRPNILSKRVRFVSPVASTIPERPSSQSSLATIATSAPIAPSAAEAPSVSDQILREDPRVTSARTQQEMAQLVTSSSAPQEASQAKQFRVIYAANAYPGPLAQSPVEARSANATGAPYQQEDNNVPATNMPLTTTQKKIGSSRSTSQNPPPVAPVRAVSAALAQMVTPSSSSAHDNRPVPPRGPQVDKKTAPGKRSKVNGGTSASNSSQANHPAQVRAPAAVAIAKKTHLPPPPNSAPSAPIVSVSPRLGPSNEGRQERAQPTVRNKVVASVAAVPRQTQGPTPATAAARTTSLPTSSAVVSNGQSSSTSTPSTNGLAGSAQAVAAVAGIPQQATVQAIESTKKKIAPEIPLLPKKGNRTPSTTAPVASGCSNTMNGMAQVDEDGSKQAAEQTPKKTGSQSQASPCDPKTPKVAAVDSGNEAEVATSSAKPVPGVERSPRNFFYKYIFYRLPGEPVNAPKHLKVIFCQEGNNEDGCKRHLGLPYDKVCFNNGITMELFLLRVREGTMDVRTIHGIYGCNYIIPEGQSAHKITFNPPKIDPFPPGSQVLPEAPYIEDVWSCGKNGCCVDLVRARMNSEIISWYRRSSATTNGSRSTTYSVTDALAEKAGSPRASTAEELPVVAEQEAVDGGEITGASTGNLNIKVVPEKAQSSKPKDAEKAIDEGGATSGSSMRKLNPKVVAEKSASSKPSTSAELPVVADKANNEGGATAGSSIRNLNIRAASEPTESPRPFALASIAMMRMVEERGNNIPFPRRNRNQMAPPDNAANDVVEPVAPVPVEPVVAPAPVEVVAPVAAIAPVVQPAPAVVIPPALPDATERKKSATPSSSEEEKPTTEKHNVEVEAPPQEPPVVRKRGRPKGTTKEVLNARKRTQESAAASGEQERPEKRKAAGAQEDKPEAKRAKKDPSDDLEEPTSSEKDRVAQFTRSQARKVSSPAPSATETTPNIKQKAAIKDKPSAVAKKSIKKVAPTKVVKKSATKPCKNSMIANKKASGKREEKPSIKKYAKKPMKKSPATKPEEKGKAVAGRGYIKTRSSARK